MASSTSKVSFTIRRPTPVSRATSSGPDSDRESTFKVPPLPRHLTNGDSTPGSPLARSTTASPRPVDAYERDQPDSSDEEDERIQDELVTGFDKFGVQRLHKDKKAKQGPLVIPALQNRDWREVARKRKSTSQYIPASAKAETGKDGSVGGLGTKDTINSGPVLSGLQVKKPKIKHDPEDGMVGVEEAVADTAMVEDDEDEDKRALRAILNGTDANHEERLIDIIPVTVSEADAFKQDIDELPDVATLDDYARVPVSQFGAALLRGMGWKEGTAASRKPGKGLVEPYLPTARPSLLGIGAKEQEVYDDGSKKKTSANKRPERRYVPIIKKERERESTDDLRSRDQERTRSRSPKRISGSSRRSSRSRSKDRDDDGRRRERRESDYKRESDRRRYDSSRDRDRDRDRERPARSEKRESRESSRRRD